MLRRTLSVLAIVVVAGSTLAACGGDDDAAGGDGGNGGGRVSDLSTLRGNEWVLDQEASTLETVTPAVTVTARFGDDGALTGNSGCNNYSTSYEVSGSELTVSAQIASTRRLCATPANNVEAAYLERLPQVRSYSISGKVLTLGTSTKNTPLVYRAVNARDALLGSWEVVNYFRPGAVVSPILGTKLTADFAGTVSGNAGCNQYTGPYTASGTSITIGPIASTLRACADPAVDQQERDYLAALELARTFSVAGGNLTLFREDGGIAVTFAKA